MIGYLERLVAFCSRHAIPVLLVFVVAAVGCGVYAQQNLGINTDTSHLIAPDSPWQKQVAAFNATFPQMQNLTTIVVDGNSADAVADGTTSLAAALAKRPDLFRSVRQPDGGPFFNRYGLMFLPPAELSKVSDQIAQAQPLLGPLAADLSLRGLFGVLGQALDGIDQGEPGAQLRGPLGIFAKSTQSVVDGKPQPVDWGTLMTGKPPMPEQLRHFIEVQPVLDYAALEPGAKASQAIRDIAASLHLAEKGVRIRLTGDVPLEDDEFSSVSEGAMTGTVLTGLAVLVILFIGLRAPRLIVAIALTVVVGLIFTAAFAAAAVGTLNMISVAFAILFIGIGVDFGIQFSMRYRAELHDITGGLAPDDARAANLQALARTARTISAPLGLAALATAIGFFSFIPTDYRGVSELGVIAGTSMLIAFATNMTLLPSLLALMPSRGRAEAAGFLWAAPIDRWIERRSLPIVLLAGALALGAIVLVPSLRFDADPLDLKDPHKESTQTALELTKNTFTSPYTIDVLVRDAAAVKPMIDKLDAVPEVKQVIWLGSFVPEDQAPKLDILSQMQLFLGPLLDAAPEIAKATPAQEHQAVVDYEAHLDKFLAGPKAAELDGAAQDLAAALKGFLAMPGGGNVEALHAALLGGLPGRLDVLKESVQAAPLTVDTMPAEMKSDWIGKDGAFRLQVFAKGDMKDERQLAKFVEAVRAIVPNASGAPIEILESGRTVSNAFLDASITALVAITLVLALILRRVRDVALVLIPLSLAGLYALGTCVVSGLAFNYANVIAVPLLMGIGVAFDIYFVMAWRGGTGPVALLQTSTARAVVFSACTTTTAFGSLALSHHAGTASMGVLLMLTLAYVVLCTLVVQPALMTLIGRKRA